MQSESANLPARLPYGEGVYRRRILLVAANGRVSADLEDDFHRYGVEIEHDGDRVGAVRGYEGRYPWSECGNSSTPLQAFRGAPLSTSLRANARRGSFIANGRLGDFDSAPNASVLLPWAENSCHSFTRGIAEKALRVRGSIREFTHHADWLLADVLHAEGS
jgi:hypothetical protein